MSLVSFSSIACVSYLVTSEKSRVILYLQLDWLELLALELELGFVLVIIFSHSQVDAL